VGSLNPKIKCVHCGSKDFALRSSVPVYVTFDSEKHMIRAVNVMDEGLDLATATVRCNKCQKIVEEKDGAAQIVDSADSAGPELWPAWEFGW
jgi:DNA-directed RNA polymerase subunit RPC12/RpoP